MKTKKIFEALTRGLDQNVEIQLFITENSNAKN